MKSGDVAIYLIIGLLAHGLGDYVLQSDWMATQKCHRWWPAIAHGLMYSTPFVSITVLAFGWRGAAGLLVIGGTHAVLDRYRLARYVVWAKNFLLAPPRSVSPWHECRETGASPGQPEHLAKLMLIITDNVIHIWINSLVIIFLAGWTG